MYMRGNIDKSHQPFKLDLKSKPSRYKNVSWNTPRSFPITVKNNNKMLDWYTVNSYDELNDKVKELSQDHDFCLYEYYESDIMPLDRRVEIERINNLNNNFYNNAKYNQQSK